MGFRISGPAHGEGDRTGGCPQDDSGFPALHWFLCGLPETDPADNPVLDRVPGSISITLDESSGRYRVTVKEKSAGLIAFYSLDRLCDVLTDLEEAIQSSHLNWQVDKFRKKK